MKLSREWAMPSMNTFSIKPIGQLIQVYLKGKSIDPFANSSRLASVTNDLNPEFGTDYTLDAIEFLTMFDNESVDFVFYDPPYSRRQVSECYKGVGREVTGEDTRSDWNTKHKVEIRRILAVGGISMSFGWNSNGIGGSDMEQLEFMSVAHGGLHNDTLVMVERKLQGHLDFNARIDE